jgi:hypothetical protein
MARKRQIHWMGIVFSLLALPAALAQTSSPGPVKVTIEDDKTEISEVTLPLDPAIRVEYQHVGNMNYGVTGEGRNLTCGAGAASVNFKIDGQVIFPDGNVQPQALPPGPNGKKRTGMQAVWSRGDITITMVLEVVPGRPYAKNPGAPQKRRMDTLLIKHIIENHGAKPHQVGARVYIDTMCGNNDGAIFASPTTHPGKLLDGVMLKDKDVPEFIEMLEVPNLQNPGFKGYFTFKMGKKVESPNKIVLTRLGAMQDGWDVQAMAAGGDSAVAFFWDPREIKPKEKREVAFALGQSIACNPENEGKVFLNFAGNYEPNREFTVTAYVDDPIEGQTLTLDLPAGLELIGGRATQSVPPLSAHGQEMAPLKGEAKGAVKVVGAGEEIGARSIVLWKARVKELGSYAIRIRSSNGVTYTRNVTIGRRWDEAAIRAFRRRRPFRAFSIEFTSGNQILVSHPETVRSESNYHVMRCSDGGYVVFTAESVARLFDLPIAPVK